MKKEQGGSEIILYRFPKLWVDKWNSYRGENIINGKLRIWNKNANKWVWFKNPKPVIDSYSIEGERKRKEYHFSGFIVKGSSK